MHKNLSNQSYSQLAGSWKTVRLNIIALLESRRSLSFLTDMINWFLVKLKKQLELKFSRLSLPIPTDMITWVFVRLKTNLRLKISWLSPLFLTDMINWISVKFSWNLCWKWFHCILKLFDAFLHGHYGFQVFFFLFFKNLIQLPPAS